MKLDRKNTVLLSEIEVSLPEKNLQLFIDKIKEDISNEGFENIAKKRFSIIKSSDLSQIKNDYVENFPYIEHPENIALALKVCQEIGVDKKTALSGMLKTNPDSGALIVLNIIRNKIKNEFISAFAANDPDSTLKVWNLLKNKSSNKKN